MSWSPQQESALKAVRTWLNSQHSPQVFRLFGYAGTGKTTLATEFAKGVRGHVLYGAFTGKAALMMQKRGCWNATTIHSMIYKLDDDEDDAKKTWEPTFVLNPASAASGAKLIIIDECSMCNEELARDLMSFGCKILVLGDPAQLPPVKGTGYFTDAEPDAMLTEVHRQALGNPIISLSMQVRQGGRLQYGSYGESRVCSRADIDADQILAADQVLVGLNKTRRSYNQRIRQLRGFCNGDDPGHVKNYMPKAGERLVCLRNNKEKRLLNGSLWDTRLRADLTATGLVALHVVSEDHIESLPTKISVRSEFFNGKEEILTQEQLRGTDQFTFGYALTVHKSQGSQWPNVVVFDESSSFHENSKRHLYTSITRAQEKVTIVSG